MMQKTIDTLAWIIFYFSFFFLFTNCSTIVIKPIHPTIHNGSIVEEDFIPYIENFERYYGKSISIRMSFKDLSGTPSSMKEGKVIGICNCFYFCPLSQRSVNIDTLSWEYSDRESREQLIFHELGHCILNRWHDNSFIKKKIGLESYKMQKSIMNKTAFADKFTYWINKEYYYEELFGKKLTPKK